MPEFGISQEYDNLNEAFMGEKDISLNESSNVIYNDKKCKKQFSFNLNLCESGEFMNDGSNITDEQGNQKDMLCIYKYNI